MNTPSKSFLITTFCLLIGNSCFPVTAHNALTLIAKPFKDHYYKTQRQRQETLKKELEILNRQTHPDTNFVSAFIDTLIVGGSCIRTVGKLINMLSQLYQIDPVVGINPQEVDQIIINNLKPIVGIIGCSILAKKLLTTTIKSQTSHNTEKYTFEQQLNRWDLYVTHPSLIIKRALGPQLFSRIKDRIIPTERAAA